MTPTIVRADAQGRAAWRALRAALWPDDDPAEHDAGIDAMLADPAAHGAWMAQDAAGEMVGLAEASLRHDHVNGCDTTPVAFLEALYVAPAHRRQGVARALNAAVVAWARARGIHEYASDALLHNVSAHAVHAALGFVETERVVCYRRSLSA